MASIKVVGGQPIENHNFTLTCKTAGDVESITWMYGWSPLYPDNTTNFSMDNATLTFDPVMKSDNGSYRCVASNPLSSLTSESFVLDVFCEYSAIFQSVKKENSKKMGFNQNQTRIPPSNTLILQLKQKKFGKMLEIINQGRIR